MPGKKLSNGTGTAGARCRKAIPLNAEDCLSAGDVLAAEESGSGLIVSERFGE